MEESKYSLQQWASRSTSGKHYLEVNHFVFTQSNSLEVHDSVCVCRWTKMCVESKHIERDRKRTPTHNRSKQSKQLHSRQQQGETEGGTALDACERRNATNSSSSAS